MKFKTSDDTTLSYDDLGEGTPILILTGIGGSRQIWQSQVKTLLAAGYRVINVDARNQGASEHTAKGLRISRHAVDIQELITYLQLPQVILLGNSMGAATCFAYVSLFGDRQLKAIIDVDQSPKMINDATWPYGYQDLTWSTFPDYLKLPMGKATKKRIADDLFATVKTVAQNHPYDADLNYPFLVDHAFQDWRDVIQA
ncbi:alpha/beta hydrolase fold [Agrilactobacillus composti DSM 18527 = JCM 14202]|nr:alpha/beta hydrolase fold [Agrilactobacillus composti DSM 18527 = JCM 14202]